jgi:predicted metal-dependent enzyme (double-stranded beta helix superfamily)
MPMPEAVSPAVLELIDRLDEAVRLGNVERITVRIKDELSRVCARSLRLPEEMTRCAEGSYARRLLHRDEGLGYTAVVMTWGPGQHTPLHDHAGMWCVECVVEGELDVLQYDLVEQQDGRSRFREANRVRAGVGDAGCLIPPFEYHVLANARADHKAVTLHIYEGEMDRCNLYVPEDDGWWSAVPRQLGYNN